MIVQPLFTVTDIMWYEVVIVFNLFVPKKWEPCDMCLQKWTKYWSNLQYNKMIIMGSFENEFDMQTIAVGWWD